MHALQLKTTGAAWTRRAEKLTAKLMKTTYPKVDVQAERGLAAEDEPGGAGEQGKLQQRAQDAQAADRQKVAEKQSLAHLAQAKAQAQAKSQEPTLFENITSSNHLKNYGYESPTGARPWYYHPNRLCTPMAWLTRHEAQPPSHPALQPHTMIYPSCQDPEFFASPAYSNPKPWAESREEKWMLRGPYVEASVVDYGRQHDVEEQVGVEMENAGRKYIPANMIKHMDSKTS